MTIKELEQKLKRIDEKFDIRFVDKNGIAVAGKNDEELFLETMHKGDIQIYLDEYKIITITDKYDIKAVEIEEGVIDINAMELYIEMLQVADKYIKSV